MTKDQFFKQLQAGLHKLPSEEQKDIMQDYEEHFFMGMEEGKTEEEIAHSLGSPQQIAKELLATFHLEKVENTVSTGNIFRALWAVIGLGFFNMVIVLGPFIAIVALIVSGWIVGVSFLLSPLLVVVDSVLQPSGFEFFRLFMSILLVGLGIFIAIGMYYLTKFSMKGFVRYLKFNAKLVKGGLKND
ncbi:HAAS signaling domain-containing protein [Niallia sp. FSL W8-0635]|uniref:HAAS signaling domain-containing protein n=1 Tax=Niallia sp. FSL W8-0635 TaxID=2975337 RepID=UPI0030F945D7